MEVRTVSAHSDGTLSALNVQGLVRRNFEFNEKRHIFGEKQMTGERKNVKSATMSRTILGENCLPRERVVVRIRLSIIVSKRDRAGLLLQAC